MSVSCRSLVIFVLAIAISGCAIDSQIPLSSVTPNICTLEAEGEFQFGEGTNNNPYIICTSEQFLKIQSNEAYWSQSFRLAADIDLSTESSVSPIGRYDSSAPGSALGFSGQFDGNDFTIRGVSLEAPTQDDAVGLFAYTNGATISNLKISNFDIKAFQKGALLVGSSLNTSFYNIELSGSVGPRTGEDVGFDLGGLIGYGVVDDSSKAYEISNIIINNITISGHDLVGALAGRILANSDNLDFSIEGVDSQSTFTHSSSGNTIGGVVGLINCSGANNACSFKNIRHVGDVAITEGGGSWSGGIFGQLYVNGDQSSATIEEVSYFGDLSSIADFNLGGAIGTIVGNLAFNGKNSTYNISKVAAESDISILSNAIGTNNCWGGLFGQLGANDNTSSTLTLSDSYFKGHFSTANSNNLQHVAGILGCFRTSGAGSAVSQFRRVYANFTESISSATTSNTLAIVGSFLSGSPTSPTVSFTDVYFTAPVLFVGGSGEAEPTNSAEVNSLNSTQAEQQASYSGWDFSSVWTIEEGQDSPSLRGQTP